MLPMLPGLIIGGIGALTKGLIGIKQNSLANKIHPQQVTYAESPFSRANLGLASQLFHARMAGANQAEQNFGAAQANMMANASRNATDGSQAMVAAAAAQAMANQGYSNLAAQEAQNQQNLASGVYAANQGMISEGDKVYADKLRKYQEDVQTRAALRNASWQNFGGLFSDLAGTAFMGQQLGLFDKKPTQNPRPATNFPGIVPTLPSINTGLIPI